MENLNRLDNEELDEYKKRLYRDKDLYGVTWQVIADLINSITGEKCTESKYRKEARRWDLSKYAGKSTKDEPIYNHTDPGEDLLMKIKAETRRASDERIQARSYFNRISREETIKEIAKEMADKFSKNLPLMTFNRPIIHDNTEVGAILQLSDWHLGIEIDNYWNKFNPTICAERVKKVVEETIAYCSRNNVTRLAVVNLSDLIAGRIHSQIRIQSTYDVMEQTMVVSEMMCEALIELSKHFNIDYYDCSDNHSRIEPDKKESVDPESLYRLIHWYLARVFKESERVCIHDNMYNEDIISFKFMGWNIGGVHGDDDKPNKVVSNISLMTGERFDLMLTAHLHHFSGDEQDGCVVISNGSLMGTDSYAAKLHLRSASQQNLIIVTKNNPCDSIHRIVV